MILMVYIDMPFHRRHDIKRDQSLSPEDGKILTEFPKEVPLLIQVTASLRNLASNQYKQFLTEDRTKENPSWRSLDDAPVGVAQHGNWWVFGVNLRLLIFGDGWWCLDGKFFKGTSKRTFRRKTKITIHKRPETKMNPPKNGFAIWFYCWECKVICSMLDFGGILCLHSWAGSRGKRSAFSALSLLGSQPDRWLWWGFTW